jgi:hypothetical protein
MNKESIYNLLMRSEERTRNVVEIALYALFALSAVVSLWQFAHQPSSLPLKQIRATSGGCVVERVIC